VSHVVGSSYKLPKFWKLMNKHSSDVYIQCMYVKVPIKSSMLHVCFGCFPISKTTQLFSINSNTDFKLHRWFCIMC